MAAVSSFAVDENKAELGNAVEQPFGTLSKRTTTTFQGSDDGWEDIPKSACEADSPKSGGGSDKEKDEAVEADDGDLVVSATGWVGLAGMKSKSSQWNMYPALRNEIAFVLDFLAAQSVALAKEIAELDDANRRRGKEDYRSLLPRSRYGKRRKQKMMELSSSVDLFLNVFRNASFLLDRPKPKPQHHSQLWNWIGWGNLDKAVCGFMNDPEEFRLLGKRKSSIDNWVLGLPAKYPKLFLFKPMRKIRSCNGYRVEGFNVQRLIIFARAIVLLLALGTIIVPLGLLYLMTLSQVGAVTIALMFCALFCVGTFTFSDIQTDHKFLLVFAYGSIMAAFLSNIGVKPGT